MYLKSQTATEYLVILGVVITVSIITVTSLSNIPIFGSDLSKSENDLLLKTQPVGVISYTVDNSLTYLEVINNVGETIELTEVIIGGEHRQICTVNGRALLVSGASKNIPIGFYSENEILDEIIEFVYVVKPSNAEFPQANPETKLLGRTADNVFESANGDYSLNVSHDSNSYNWGESVMYDSCGFATIAGGTNNDDGNGIFIMRVDNQGNVLWKQTHLGYRAHDVHVNNLGEVFVAGSSAINSNDSETRGGGGFSDIITLKFDSAGNYLWNATLGTSNPNFEGGFGINIDTRGNIYTLGRVQDIIGPIQGTGGSADIVLIKYDENGSYLWNRTFGSNSNEYGYGDVVFDTSGNIYISGFGFGSYTGVVGGGGFSDTLLIKYDSDGTYQWDVSFGGSSAETIDDMKLSDSEFIYASGYTQSFGAGGQDFLLLKYDLDGNLIWNQSFGSSSNDLGYGVSIDLDENIYVAGIGNDMNSNITYGGSGGGSDFLLVKFNLNGVYQWNRTFGSASSDQAYDVDTSRDGRVSMIGSSNGFNANGFDLYLVELS